MRNAALFFLAGYGFSAMGVHWMIVVLVTLVLLAAGRERTNTMRVPEGWRPIPDERVGRR